MDVGSGDVRRCGPDPNERASCALWSLVAGLQGQPGGFGQEINGFDNVGRATARSWDIRREASSTNLAEPLVGV